MQKITTSDRRALGLYFTQLPNIIDDASLTVYEFRLLVHYTRVVGSALEGAVTESAETTAKKCNMSVGKVSQCRQALADAGWIDLDKSGRYYIVTVKDVWVKNFLNYASQQQIDAQSERLAELGYHKIPTSKRRVSTSSNAGKRKSAKKSSTADKRHQPLITAYFKRLGYTPAAPAKEGKAAKNLLKQYPELTVEQILDCYDSLKSEKFWKTKPVSLVTVHQQIGEWLQRQRPVVSASSADVIGFESEEAF